MKAKVRNSAGEVLEVEVPTWPDPRYTLSSWADMIIAARIEIEEDGPEPDVVVDGKTKTVKWE
jgi:hypothetical protein